LILNSENGQRADEDVRVLLGSRCTQEYRSHDGFSRALVLRLRPALIRASLVLPPNASEGIPLRQKKFEFSVLKTREFLLLIRTPFLTRPAHRRKQNLDHSEPS
jgi:hypothetical protein